MRFFKYLIFVLLSFLSIQVYADYLAWDGGTPNNPTYSASGSTPASACASMASIVGTTYGSTDGTVCRDKYKNVYANIFVRQDQECPHPNTVTAVANVGAKLEAVRCVPLSGTNKFCVYKKSPNTLIINVPSSSNPEQGALAYDLVSQSKIPVDNCTPLFEGQCDPKDPYGGCFKIPDDGCTRTQNGSIICPNNETPNVQSNCTGTYCERPPTGCPSGYVSGSFNGKALCVKSSPSNGSGSGSGSGDGSGTDNGNGSGNGDGSGSGNGNGSGSGSGSNSSTSSSTSTSTSTSTSSNGNGGSTTVNVTNNNTNNTTVNVDTSGIIGAINNMKSSLADFLNDINNAVNGVNNTLGGTNQKLDNANTKLDKIDQNGKDTNTKLDQLINKGGANGEFDDTGIINAIEKQTTDLKDHYDESLKTDDSDFDTSQYENIGEASQDSRYLGAQSQAQSALQSFANKLTFSNTACVQDFEVQVPLYGSMLVPLSKWCDLLAIVKILLQLGTLMVALKMIDATVRVF